MKFYNSLLAIATVAIIAASSRDRTVDGADEPRPSMGFFVTSAKSKTGNLGGLAAADKICQDLAIAVGQMDKTWRAYLSVERDTANNNKPTNARDRIGNGPWFNANGLMVGKDLPDLHERKETRFCSSTNGANRFRVLGLGRRNPRTRHYHRVDSRR